MIIKNNSREISQIKDISDLPKWFNLKNYEGIEKFNVKDWYLSLKFRFQLIEDVIQYLPIVSDFPSLGYRYMMKAVDNGEISKEEMEENIKKRTESIKNSFGSIKKEPLYMKKDPLYVKKDQPEVPRYIRSNFEFRLPNNAVREFTKDIESELIKEGPLNAPNQPAESRRELCNKANKIIFEMPYSAKERRKLDKVISIIRALENFQYPLPPAISFCIEVGLQTLSNTLFREKIVSINIEAPISVISENIEVIVKKERRKLEFDKKSKNTELSKESGHKANKQSNDPELFKESEHKMFIKYQILPYIDLILWGVIEGKDTFNIKKGQPLLPLGILEEFFRNEKNREKILGGGLSGDEISRKIVDIACKGDGSKRMNFISDCTLMEKLFTDETGNEKEGRLKKTKKIVESLFLEEGYKKLEIQADWERIEEYNDFIKDSEKILILFNELDEPLIELKNVFPEEHAKMLASIKRDDYRSRVKNHKLSTALSEGCDEVDCNMGKIQRKEKIKKLNRSKAKTNKILRKRTKKI
ncbi:MAG: DUF6387 family protein [Rickettsiales bacterium]|jgi:hypothetical protein|nr:DUF6387 family protein [Rickettsiales bacterium]